MIWDGFDYIDFNRDNNQSLILLMSKPWKLFPLRVHQPPFSFPKTTTAKPDPSANSAKSSKKNYWRDRTHNSCRGESVTGKSENLTEMYKDKDQNLSYILRIVFDYTENPVKILLNGSRILCTISTEITTMLGTGVKLYPMLMDSTGPEIIRGSEILL